MSLFEALSLNLAKERNQENGENGVVGHHPTLFQGDVIESRNRSRLNLVKLEIIKILVYCEKAVTIKLVILFFLIYKMGFLLEIYFLRLSY